jgi:hypothetical protein
MNTLPLATETPEAPLFCDGVGERVVVPDGATGELLQILRIRPALTSVPSFEFALRERTARLANFRHAYYARVRRVDRIQVPGQGLAVVSDHVEGTRLSDILRVAHERRLQLDTNAALCLIRQLVPAVALIHENARDVAHGLIAPERLVVTSQARLVIVEHVLAAAIDRLQLGRDRLWQEFRIATPPSAGLPRFDHRADVTAVGLVALALLLGRPLSADEFPHRVPALLNGTVERTALGEEQPLSAPLREWLGRALQLDSRRPFASAPEAYAALEELVAGESTYVPAPIALETFLSRYIAALLEPAPSDAPPARRATSAVTDRTGGPGVSSNAASVDVDAAISGPLAFEVVPSASKSAAAAVSADASSRVAAPEVSTEPVGSIEQSPEGSAETAEANASAPVREITELIGATDLSAGRDAVKRLPAALFDDASGGGAAARRRRARWRRAAVALGTIAALAAGIPAWRYFRGAATGSTQPVQMGSLVVQSSPGGVQVVVDGVERGLTPARLSVTPGAHILELRGRGLPRVMPFNVAAGAQVSQYVEFAETASTGQLQVQSQPAGAKVAVDGVDRGIAPVTVSQLAPGDHEVVMQTPAGSARQSVNVQAGATASLILPIATAETTAGPVSGWVAVNAPVTIEIKEQGRLLGTSDADRVMLAAGRHEIELVNQPLGYRATRTVNVQPGKLTPLTVELPNGVVNLNANPWAEVWIDGQRVGETPIGNLSVPIGPHEIVFRNPKFGEKRHAISVTLAAPARLSVDMKK